MKDIEKAVRSALMEMIESGFAVLTEGTLDYFVGKIIDKIIEEQDK